MALSRWFFPCGSNEKTALDTLLLKHLLPKFGTDPRYVLWGLMLITALMSMFMSNTATTAMMIATISPIFVTLDKKANLSRALLLGIPAAASIYWWNGNYHWLSTECDCI